MRVAFSRIASKTDFTSPGDELITLRTSAVAISRSKAWSRSRRNRATSVALPLGVFALWRRALASLLLALERRRIAHPRLRTTPFFKVDYSRDLRPVEWGSGVSLHGGSQKVQPMRLHQRSAARRRLSRLEPPSRRP